MVVVWGLSCKPITLILHSNLQMFVTVVTVVGLIQIKLCSYIRWKREQPLGYLVKNRGLMCYTEVEIRRFFLLKFSNFRYHGNRGRLSKAWLTPLNWPILKTPYCMQVSWMYLIHKLSYSQFCVENRKFSLPWQQGSVWAEYGWHSFIGWHWKP